MSRIWLDLLRTSKTHLASWWFCNEKQIQLPMSWNAQEIWGLGLSHTKTIIFADFCATYQHFHSKSWGPSTVPKILQESWFDQCSTVEPIFQRNKSCPDVNWKTCKARQHKKKGLRWSWWANEQGIIIFPSQWRAKGRNKVRVVRTSQLKLGGQPPSQDSSHHQDYEPFLVGNPNQNLHLPLLLMAEILHHLGCMKPYK